MILNETLQILNKQCIIRPVRSQCMGDNIMYLWIPGGCQGEGIYDKVNPITFDPKLNNKFLYGSQ